MAKLFKVYRDSGGVFLSISKNRFVSGFIHDNDDHWRYTRSSHVDTWADEEIISVKDLPEKDRLIKFIFEGKKPVGQSAW